MTQEAIPELQRQKVMNRLTTWNEQVKFKNNLQIINQKVPVYCLNNLSILIESSIKYFLLNGTKRTELTNLLKVFFKNHLFIEEKKFSLVKFIEDFSKLEMDIKQVEPLLNKIAELMSCWKIYTPVIAIYENIVNEILKIPVYQVDLSESSDKSFQEIFVSFIDLCKSFGSFQPHFENIQKRYTNSNDPKLAENLIDEFSKHFQLVFSEQDSDLQDYPLELKITKNVLNDVSLEQNKKVISGELKLLKERVRILKEKQKLVKMKIENVNLLGPVKEHFQKLSEHFKESQTVWKGMLDKFEKNNLLDLFSRSFENILKNAEIAVKNDKNVSLSNQMINKSAKLKADFNRYFFPIIKDTEKKNEMIEKVEKYILLCSSMREKANSSELSESSTPAPTSNPTIEINLRDLMSLTLQVGYDAVEMLNSNDVLNVRDSVNVFSEESAPPQELGKLFGKNDIANLNKKGLPSLKTLEQTSGTNFIPIIGFENFVCKWDLNFDRNLPSNKLLLPLKSGDVFTVMHKEGEWFFGYCASSKESGWVNSSNLMDDEPENY